ncbi:MAG TPA: diacylglycerol kinase family protein [Patescibacteria group bacterium]|nr:diacylglycerol kinase family protein [Patescibacteria group bacterium]
MYVYLYDNFLRHKKFAQVVKNIEVRLTDYGIGGKILRLNNFIDSKPIIEDEIKKGAKTVVIVGNDHTFGHVLSRGATCDCTFGFLPVGPENTIADVLGIPVGEEACDVLSRRRKESLDVGWMNNRYFVSQLHVLPAKVQVVYDERFKVYANEKMEVVVCNLQPYYWKLDKKDKDHQVVHPQDGKLEAFLRPLRKKSWWGYQYEDPSIFPFEEMQIIGKEPFTVVADGKTSKEIKVTIKLAHNKIDMVVGRNRKF